MAARMKVVLDGFDERMVDWCMDESDVRRVLSKRGMTVDVLMAVLHGLRMWDGLKVDSGKVRIDCYEFSLFLANLLNRVIDKEACEYLQPRMKVPVEPDRMKVQFENPPGLHNDPRFKAAREMAALSNFERRLEREKSRLREQRGVRLLAQLQQPGKRSRQDDDDEEQPPTRRSRWDSDSEFGIETTPDFYEDRVSFVLLYVIGWANGDFGV
jgi:hypothetical protein